MILSYLLAGLIVVHIAGSLRHHFIKRNDVMRRMWLGARPAASQNADQPVGPALHSVPAKNLGS
jgi:cytochrome b